MNEIVGIFMLTWETDAIEVIILRGPWTVVTPLRKIGRASVDRN